MMEPLRSKPRLRLARLAIALALAGTASIAAINVWMVKSTRARIFTTVGELPRRGVGIVLGTSAKLGDGRWKNPFFESRMDAAAQLYREGKLTHLLVSGDNSRKDYDEPTMMRDALIRRGVPELAVTRDYAGFRTLDTMARARTVFGQRSVVLITDDFHLPRSLFLAEKHDLDAIGFSPEPVPARWSKKTRAREVASRVKAWLDVYLLRKKPKFYGPPVELPPSSVEPAVPALHSLPQ